MNGIKEKDAFKKSLDITDDLIIHFIPYLLQDLWSLGGYPEAAVALAARNDIIKKDKRIIDLGCGKGATIIELASKFDGIYKGVDLVDDFIKEGNEVLKDKALRGSVTLLTGDMVNEIKRSERYDLMIFGYDTDILGSVKESLLSIKNLLKPNGAIIFETVFRNEDYYNEEVLSWEMLKKEIDASGLKIKDKVIWDQEIVKKINKENNIKIKQRVDELVKLHPADKEVFYDYLNGQYKESEILDHDLTCITLLLE